MTRRPLSAAPLLVSLLAAAPALSADVVVGQTAPVDERVGYGQIDHSAWDGLLKVFVNDAGRVDYRGWKASSEAVAKLDGYLNHLSTVEPKKPATRAAELAYWINAYKCGHGQRHPP